MDLLAAEQPDLFAVETAPDADEAEVLVGLLNELDLPAWFSYNVAGERTRAGQPLADAVLCDPVDVLPAVEVAVATSGRPAVCYPNSGEAWTTETDEAPGQWSGKSTFDAGLAPAWVNAGATYVGGCCRVGPAQIADLVARLNATDAQGGR